MAFGRLPEADGRIKNIDLVVNLCYAMEKIDYPVNI